MSLRKFTEIGYSLVFRLTIMYAVAFSLLASIGLLVFYYRIYFVSIQILDVELSDETRHYAEILESSGPDGLITAIVDKTRMEDPQEDFYRLFDLKGTTVMNTDMSSWGTVDTQEILRAMHKDGLSTKIQSVTIEGRDDKARLITAMIGPDTVLQIGESLEEVNDYLHMFLYWFAGLMTCLIALSTLIGWRLARRATRDMNEVTKTARQITNGAYQRRVTLRGRLTEVRLLGATFNRMLDRIESLLKSMKEINDNIAHDLRSPLARIRGTAEMSLLQDRSKKAYKEMAASTIEECDALTEMINTMLDITEAEAGVNGGHAEPSDLVVLIKGACELFRPIAGSKKILLTMNLPEKLIIKSDRKKIERVVTNLLENAIKYTPENNTVTISASHQKGRVRLLFEDTGIGIAQCDLPYIFDRFFRCDQSRAQGGVGLGLSLVKAYAESMNGTIEVESSPDKGSRFSLYLPS